MGIFFGWIEIGAAHMAWNAKLLFD